MNDPLNGVDPTPPPPLDPGVIIGGNWYPTGTLDSDGDGTPDQYDSFPWGSFWYNSVEYGGSWNDRDGDSIPDPADPFPDGSFVYNGVEYAAPYVDQDGDQIPDVMDRWPTIAWSFWYNGNEYPGGWNDQDGDGTPDVADATPNGSYWWQGVEYLGPWVDQDGDGTPDAFDRWPTIAGSYTYNGTEYPGTVTDSDGDGIPNDFDPWPYGGDPTPPPPDSDNDGIPDYNDSTPNGSYWYNGTEYAGSWSDQDNDGIPDGLDATPNGGYWYNGVEYAGAWTDSDGDFVPDPADAFPNVAGSYWYNGTEYAGGWSDQDNDGIPDAQDSYPNDFWNAAPHFSYNGTEYPGSIDDDRDSDGVPDAADNWPDDPDNNADSDNDGISNYAERTQYQTDPNQQDTDGEGLTDYEELFTWHTDPLQQKTNPNQLYTDYYTVDQTDSDGDQIPDRIEQWYVQQGYGMSAGDPNDAKGDLDGDGYTNLQAYRNGWSFIAHLNQYDNDGDGIFDVIEDAWSASYPNILSSNNFNDAVEDFDNDGVLNFEEIALGLNPGVAYSRSSAVHDLLEWAWRQHLGMNGNWQVMDDTNQDAVPDGLLAFVNDYNTSSSGVTLSSRASSTDYDGDGMSDVWEYRYHLNLRDAGDAQNNNDGDSLTNVLEYQQNRDPLVNDDPPPPPPLTLSGGASNGAVGAAYSSTFSASGGTPGYSYSISSGAMPDGLSLDNNSGVLSGTPVNGGTFDFSVNVNDSNFQSTSLSCQVTIAGLEITTSSLPVGSVLSSYSTSINATRGSAPYTFSVVSPQPDSGETGLPSGYALQENGTLTGMADDGSGALSAGTHTFTVQVSDSAAHTATKQFTLVVAMPETTTGSGGGSGDGGGDGAGGGNGTTATDPNALKVIASDMGGAKASAFSGQVSASGGVLPYSFSCSGLPGGLSIDSETGKITGTPSSVGTSTATAQVSDGAETSVSKTITITIADVEENDGTNGNNNGDDEETDDTNTGTTDDKKNEPPAPTPPKILSVSFKAAPLMDDLHDNNPIILTSDNGTETYTEPQWESESGGHHYPVAYVSSASPYVEVTFDPGVSSGSGGQDTVTRIRTSSTSQQKIAGAGSEGFVLSGDTGVVKMQALPEYTWFYNADEEGEEYSIEWEIKRPGDADFVSAGTTKHTVYLVRKAPLTSLRQETIFNIGCRNAIAIHVNQPDQMVVDAIYEEFTDREVARVEKSTGRLKNEKMTYWGSGQPSTATTGDLLASPTGDGQCGAWSKFFIDCCRAQGINGVQEITITPPPAPPGISNDRLETMIATYTGLEKGKIRIGTSVPVLWVKHSFAIVEPPPEKISLVLRDTSVGGIPSQGNPNPNQYFQNHAIVYHGGKLYDPSYGVPTFDDLPEWEEASVDYLGGDVFWHSVSFDMFHQMIVGNTQLNIFLLERNANCKVAGKPSSY